MPEAQAGRAYSVSVTVNAAILSASELDRVLYMRFLLKILRYIAIAMWKHAFFFKKKREEKDLKKKHHVYYFLCAFVERSFYPEHGEGGVDACVPQESVSAPFYVCLLSLANPQ